MRGPAKGESLKAYRWKKLIDLTLVLASIGLIVAFLRYYMTRPIVELPLEQWPQYRYCTGDHQVLEASPEGLPAVTGMTVRAVDAYLDVALDFESPLEPVRVSASRALRITLAFDVNEDERAYGDVLLTLQSVSESAEPVRAVLDSTAFYTVLTVQRAEGLELMDTGEASVIENRLMLRVNRPEGLGEMTPYRLEIEVGETGDAQTYTYPSISQ